MYLSGGSIENLDNNPSIVHAPSLFSPQTKNAATSNKPIRCGAAEKQQHMTPKQLQAATPTHPGHNLSSASNHPGLAMVGSRTLTNLDGESDGEQLGMCVFMPNYCKGH